MSGNKKTVLLTALILCFAAVSYAQIAAGVMFLRKRVHHLTQQDASGADKVVKELTKELDLTPEQQAKAGDIVMNTRKGINAALEQGENDLNSILTAEQKDKLDKYREKIKDEIKAAAGGKE